MAIITLKGRQIKTVGALPKIGSLAPDFTLTKIDLSELTLKQCFGKKTVLSIFPSIDTNVCATAMRHFNETAEKIPNVNVLCVSADLPFAQKRFCGAENLSKVTPVSTFRHPDFGVRYGATIKDSELAGLLSRAIVVLDEKGKVIYTEQVTEIANEPNYEAVLNALS